MGNSSEDVSIPGLSGERRASISLFADKVARRLSTTYSVDVPDPSSFTAVAKAIFGPSGGGVQCKGVFVDLPEGSLTSQTKEVCIQLCKAKTEVVPLGDTETIISHLVEISPHGKPLSKHAVLSLPTKEAPKVGYEQFLRWTPTQSGVKASWSDVYACGNQNPCGGNQTTVELSEGKARVNTIEFGIFCIISRESNEEHEPLRERSTSDAIREFSGDVSTANEHDFQSAYSLLSSQGDQTVEVNISDTYSTPGTVNDDPYTTSSHHMEKDRHSTDIGKSFRRRISHKFKRSDKSKGNLIAQTESNVLNSESSTIPPSPLNPPEPPAPRFSASPPPPSPSDPAPTSPSSDMLPPPPPPPPPPAPGSSAPASGEDNSFAAMLQARKKNIIG